MAIGVAWQAGPPPVVATIAAALQAVGIYWLIAAGVLALYTWQRRRDVLDAVAGVGLMWLTLWLLGALLVVLVPCAAPNASAALGLLVALTLGYLLPRQRWQRWAVAAAVVLIAIAQGIAAGCRLWPYALVTLGLIVVGLVAVRLAGRWAPVRRWWQRTAMRVDRYIAGAARMHLTPGQRAALRARLCWHLGFSHVTFRTIGADGAHASTPIVATGHMAHGEQRHYFVKVISQANWRASLAARLWRWLEHRGRLEQEPIPLSLRDEAQHEHYMLLLFSALGVPVPTPRGLYRLRPQVYALISDYLEGARPLRDVGRASECFVRRALLALRRLRDADCAHADIKASNLMVLPGDGFAFVDVGSARNNANKRRRAEDLADMLAALAMHQEPAAVVAIAREIIGDEGLREALPYLRGPTLNTETQKLMPLGLPRQLRRLIEAQLEPARSP